MFDPPGAENLPRKTIGHVDHDEKLIFCEGFGAEASVGLWCFRDSLMSFIFRGRYIT